MSNLALSLIHLAMNLFHTLMNMYEYPKFPLSYQNFPYLYVLFSLYFPDFQNLLLNGNKEETRKRDRMRESAIKRVSCKTKILGGEGSPTKLQPPYSKTRRPPCFHDHKNDTHGTPNTTTCRSVFSGMPHPTKILPNQKAWMNITKSGGISNGFGKTPSVFPQPPKSDP